MTTSFFDQGIVALDRAFKVLGNAVTAQRSVNAAGTTGLTGTSGDEALSEQDKRQAAGLMRVNHVGEICAQALYQAQAHASSSAELRDHYARAADEELDHLAWTAQRLGELSSHTSLLNPLWYVGSYAFGLVAGRAGDALSLGFVVETERQVEQHLESHLKMLPEADHRSREIVRQMAEDERGHADQALARGARELPFFVRGAMRLAAKVMTTTAYWI
jgi:ubiquinone biosynthesis monooxygenase Coq7